MSSTVADLSPRVKDTTNPQSVDEQSAHEGRILRFFLISVLNLLIGTIQGVTQTFPGIAQWIRESGPAGHLIDPLAHAHINLVGGVTMGMMGLFYYVLPKLVHRPIYSMTLASVSFWFSALGVATFYVSLVILGLIEGNMIHNGMTYGQALEAVGAMHHILIITGAMLMGLGYWTYITNVFLTVYKKRR
ncbi:MAG TPA: cytochrome-c oxidase [Gammaproteobacteria bacterium]|nr:cytochrome-c oxidase [Gammaproteobacteria bacterium]